MTEHQHQGHRQHTHREFERGDRFVEGRVAGAAHLEQLAGPAGEQPGRIHPGIGAAEQGRKGTLALGQGVGIDLAGIPPERFQPPHPLLG